jgi:hypothetical protein
LLHAASFGTMPPPEMTLPFALRTRIDLREEPRRARAFRLPKLTGPIFAYWSAMGLLAYGVSSGALPLEEWIWPGPQEPVFEAPAAPPPPARVAPFEVEPANAAPATELEDAPLAKEETPLPEPAPVAALSRAEDAPAATQAPATEPRRVTLSLNYTPPARLEEAPARLEPVPAHATAAERPAPERESAREPRAEPTPHLAWNEPGWGAAAGPRDSRRVTLTSPDAARGRRHVGYPESDDFLFPAGPANGTGGGAPPKAPVAAVAPPFEPDRDVSPRESEPRRAAANVGSCEAAAAAATDEMDLTKSDRGAPDVTRDAYASILDNGRYLSGCRIPSSVRFEICAAVRDGRAIGVTVTTTPRNASVAACVRAAVSRLSFPSSPRLDVTRTHFEPAR